MPGVKAGQFLYENMYMYIKRLNEDYPVEYILHKKPKSHGLNEYGEIISVPKDTKLLIIPDASSNDYEYHQELQEKGVDIVILDHHEAEKISEHATYPLHLLQTF